jgi:xylitol oxidase
LASLPHISVIGACATATHGSGKRNGNLGAAVRAIEIVTAQGAREVFSKDTHGDQFHGMIAHLGALGIVTKIDLEVVPTYSVAQTVYERLKLAELERNFNAITGSSYSVSLFSMYRTARNTRRLNN